MGGYLVRSWAIRAIQLAILRALAFLCRQAMPRLARSAAEEREWAATYAAASAASAAQGISRLDLHNRARLRGGLTKQGG